MSCVTLHFTITLLNFIDDTKSKRHGRCLLSRQELALSSSSVLHGGYRNTLFSPADGEGWRNVAKVISIAEPDSGFLREDYFTLVVDMRVILQENETHVLQVDGNSAVCTVSKSLDLLPSVAYLNVHTQWRLRHIKDMSPLVALTETFIVGDTKWSGSSFERIHFSDAIAFVFRRLEAYPNGCATNSEELCVYLVNRSKQSVCVHFELRAENQYSSDEDVAKGE